MRGVKLTELNIEALVSGNLRINGMVYTPQQADAEFKDNKHVKRALNIAHEYHQIAKDDRVTVPRGIENINVMLNMLIKGK